MADMSEMLKNFSTMMNGKEIPDNIKEMMNSLVNNNSNNNSNNANNSNNSSDSTYNSGSGNSGNSNSSFDGSGIDIETMMKLQKVMSAMNSSSNSSGANLLRSLKPFLKPSRQSKVDEYIQLLNIEKVIGLMNPSGGDKK